MVANTLSILLRNSIDAVVLATVIAVLVLVLREKLAAKWRFLLLGLVLVRLALPVLPASPIGLSFWPSDSIDSMQWSAAREPVTADTASLRSAVDAPDASPATVATTPVLNEPAETDSPVAARPTTDRPTESEATPPSVPAGREVEQPASTPYSWPIAILSIWMLGVVVLGFRHIRTRLKLRSLLKTAMPCFDAPLLSELEQSRKLVGLHQHVRFDWLDRLSSPAVTGIMRPRILCPQSIAAVLSPDDMRLLLMHELMHVRRRDVLVQSFANVLCVIYWFHPVAWWVRWRMERERELACDEAVLGLLSTESREQYGHTAIRLLELQQSPSLSPGLVAWSGDKQHLKRRIEMIARFRAPRRWQSSLAALLTLALAVTALTRAADPASSVDAQTETAAITSSTTGIAADDVPEGAQLLAGRCVDEAGVALPGVSLRLVHVDYETAQVDELAAATSDDNGEFAFPPLILAEREPESQYRVIAQLEGRATLINYLGIGDDDPALWDEMELTLGEASWLKGRVYDAAGDPVVVADVYIMGWPNRPLSGVWHDVTNEIGVYNIDDLPLWEPTSDFDPETEEGWSVTEYFFYVSHPDFGQKRVVAGERPLSVNVMLDIPAHVDGRVVYEDGSPAVNVEVCTQSIQNGYWSQGRTDADGRYRFQLQQADKYNIWANADDLICEAAIDSLEVNDGETQEVRDLVLGEGAFVTGHVLDADTGRPLASYPENTSIASYGPHRPRSGHGCISTPVREDGSFELRVAPGSVYVFLMNSDYWEMDDPWNTTVTVGDGETVVVDFHVRDPNAPDTAQRQILDAEQPAIAAITALGGWVATEEINGLPFVVEVNMVYHEPEDGPRVDNLQVTDEALYYVPKFTHLRTLLLHHGQASDEGLAHVSGLTELQRIYMWDAYVVTDEGVAYLVHLPSLEYIHLGESAVTDEALRHLSQIPTLQGIAIQNSSFTDQGLEHLSTMTQLTELWVGGSDNRITDAGVAHLSGLVNLEELDLSNSEFTDAGLASLRGLTSLKQFYLSGASITDAGLAHLSDMANLEALGLQDTLVTDAGLEQLHGLTNLKQILLSGVSVTDEGVAALQEAIPGVRVYR